MIVGMDEPLVVGDDRLGVLTTTRPVVLAAAQAILDGGRIAAVAAEWAATAWPEAGWDEALHWRDPARPERTLNFLLLLDALNFCFWGLPGEPRWGVRRGGVWRDGYAAEAAALTRAAEAGVPIWDAGYLAHLDAATLADILRPDPDDAGRTAAIPLFDRRLAHAREAGQVLAGRFGGQFAGVIEQAGGDAATLARLVAEAFPSFDDRATWDGREVRFFKRAQILVADVAGSFGGEDYGKLRGLEALTAFADYKVPQLLRRLGILRYADDLAGRIARYEVIAPGTADEVAIRAATVWGVELLRQALAERGTAVTAAAIDSRLWLAGQTPDAADQPYHRTPTGYY